MWVVALAALAFGGSSGDAPEGDAPEPIFELAEQDVRATRTARTAFVVGFAAPGVAFVGRLALAPLLEIETNFDLQVVGALGLTVAGAGGMIAAPIWLHGRARRSRHLLQAQGLEVGGSLPLAATVGLAITAPTIFLSGFTAGSDASTGTVAAAFTTYAAAMTPGVLQLSANRRARVGSGWLDASLAITPNGFKLAGNF